MQIISQEKILPWGLMTLRESDLNGYCPKGILVTFWKRAGFEEGEREIDLLVHAHYIISLFSSISSLLSSVFSLIFFFSFSCFLLLYFSFTPYVFRSCKVEFIQPSNWFYSVPNLLVIQHLVTLYLGGFDVRVVSEIE